MLAKKSKCEEEEEETTAQAETKAVSREVVETTLKHVHVLVVALGGRETRAAAATQYMGEDKAEDDDDEEEEEEEEPDVDAFDEYGDCHKAASAILEAPMQMLKADHVPDEAVWMAAAMESLRKTYALLCRMQVTVTWMYNSLVDSHSARESGDITDDEPEGRDYADLGIAEELCHAALGFLEPLVGDPPRLERTPSPSVL